MVTSANLLREQWIALRGWIADARVLDHAEAPSGLGDWTVKELVAHLGRSMDALTACRPAPELVPMSLGGYLAGYAGGAADIAETSRALATSLGDDVLGGVDALVADAFEALEALGGAQDVVLARRGPIRLDDFVLSRLTELVVHGDDLARALPDLPAPPLLDEAVQTVAVALVEVHRQRTGRSPSTAVPLRWIRRAAGREDADDTGLPLF